MKFNSKETYLAAVAIWKASYSALIIKIRQDKVAYKTAQREFASHGVLCWWKNDWTPERKQAYLKAMYAMQAAYDLTKANKKTATEMISERHASKEEAGRQMEAQKSLQVL